MIDRRALLGAGIAALALPRVAWARNAGPLDLAYVNGRIWTGVAGQPVADAMGIVGDRFAAVGAETRARIGKRTRVVDLKGAFVTPGIIDCHTHFLRSSLALSVPDLRHVKSRAEFVDRVGAAARALPRGEWLEGGNWDEAPWGGEMPTREWIDAVTPDTPVAIVRLDQHVMLCNSLALRLAGIDRNTPDPEGGLIGRDASGEPNGLIKDTAKFIVLRAIPPKSDARIEAGLRDGIAFALSKGVTQVHVPELDWTTHHGLRRLRARGETDLRFYSFVPIADWEKMAAIVKTEGRGDDWVRWGAVKGLVDGSLGSRTALFRDPYADDPANRGLHRGSLDRLAEMVEASDGAGLHVTVHAIGDRANEELLDIFAGIEARHGKRDRRFRLEHAQHLAPDLVPRFARQGIIASMQPYHAVDDGRWAEKAIGEPRTHFSWMLRSLLDAGACVALGSDWPVAPLDPLTGLAAAASRQTLDGANPGGWVPEQRISVAEALVGYTRAGAYAGFQEDRTGVIAPGMIADAAMFDRDLLRVAPETLTAAVALRTLVGGRERFTHASA